MGFLLLQYEYQRANNQYNLCERTGIRLNDQVEKYTKRVSKMQELFQKAESRLENTYTQKLNMMNTNISSASAAAGTAADWSTFYGAVSGIMIGGVSIASLVGIPSTAPTGSATEIASSINSAAGQIRQAISVLIEEYKQADIDRLHEQQDQQLEPIAEKESEYENKKNTNEALTDIWQQRRDNAKERLSQDIQNGVAKYGLK